MLENLKDEVTHVNQMLPELGLVKLTFGNASVIDREKGIIAIKPSGVDFSDLIRESIVLLDLEGNVIGSGNRPSSDYLTHLEIYRNFQGVGSIIHTHSEYATSFSQARIPLSCLGTTHADHFNGKVPVTRLLEKEEIERDYELNTGRVIVETFSEMGINPLEVPACLVASHGPFVWGKSSKEALQNAVVLEEVAKMNYRTLIINPCVGEIGRTLLYKHFFRKNGENAYYGQPK